MRGCKFLILTAAVAVSLLFSHEEGRCADTQPPGSAGDRGAVPGSAPVGVIPGTPSVEKGSASCLPGCGGEQAGVCCPACCDEKSSSPLGLYADFLFLKVRGADLLYAQPRDGFTTLSVPRGSQGIVEPDYSPGFRVGVDLPIGHNAGIVGSYLWWRSEDSSSIRTLPGSLPGTIIQPNLTLPGILNSSTSSMAASANEHYRFQMADLAYRQVFASCPDRWRLSWLAGVRYSDLKQRLDSSFAILGTTNVNTQINFDGIGPHLGLDGGVVVGGGFWLYGRATVDFLAGHFGAQFAQTNTFVGNQGVTDYRSDRIVPVTELLLGVGWSSPGGRLHLMCGYNLFCWFNTVTTPDFIHAAQNNNFTTNGNNLRDTLSFDGLTARVEISF
jgi:hypothetical protein